MTLPGWSDRIERYAVPDETYALRIERNHRAPRLKAVGSKGDVEHPKSGERSPARSAELSRQ